jgi:hypothetical protein
MLKKQILEEENMSNLAEETVPEEFLKKPSICYEMIKSRIRLNLYQKWIDALKEINPEDEGIKSRLGGNLELLIGKEKRRYKNLSESRKKLNDNYAQQLNVGEDK